MQTKTLTKERRHFLRASWPGDLAVSLLEPTGIGEIDHVNMGEGGLCLRVPANLEVRSQVRLLLASQRSGSGKRPMECTGRVAWVTQRLDLRAMPPYLFDIGIEFVNPPPVIARILTLQRGESSASARGKKLSGIIIRGRRLIPRIVRDGDSRLPWHLVVSVEDVPCFSQHFASERAALEGWAVYQRHQAKGKRA